jgi:hypothetical protein
MKVTPKGVKNFAEAVGRKAGRIAVGERLFSDVSTQNKRLSICAGCEYKEGVQCSVCECIVRAKVLFDDETCPMKKW